MATDSAFRFFAGNGVGGHAAHISVMATIALHHRNTHIDPSTGTPDTEWCCYDGALDDPPDSSPALSGRRLDGTLFEAHYRRGELNDPSDGRPAWVVRNADGTVLEARHYRRDRRIG